MSEISCLHLLGLFTWRFWHTTTTTIYTIILIITIIIQFLLHIHKKSPFCLPTLTEVALYATILYHALQAIYTIQKRLFPITFYSWKKVCGEGFCHWCWQSWAPLASHFSWFTPCILISLKDNSSFGSVRLITAGHLPIKAEWLDAPLTLQVFSQSIANTPHH